MLQSFESIHTSLEKQEADVNSSAMGKVLGEVASIYATLFPEQYKLLNKNGALESIIKDPNPAMARIIVTSLNALATAASKQSTRTANTASLEWMLDWVGGHPNLALAKEAMEEYSKIVDDSKNAMLEPRHKLSLLSRIYEKLSTKYTPDTADETRQNNITDAFTNDVPGQIKQNQKNAESADFVFNKLIATSIAKDAGTSMDDVDVVSSLNNDGLIELMKTSKYGSLILNDALTFAAKTGVVPNVIQRYLQELYRSDDPEDIGKAATWVMNYVDRTGNSASVAGTGFGNNGANIMNNLHMFVEEGGLQSITPLPGGTNNITGAMERFIARKAGNDVPTGSDVKDMIVQSNFSEHESPTTAYNKAFNKHYTAGLSSVGGINNAGFQKDVETVFFANLIMGNDSKYDIEKMMQYAIRTVIDSGEWGLRSHYDYGFEGRGKEVIEGLSGKISDEDWKEMKPALKFTASFVSRDPQEIVRYPILNQLDNFGMSSKYEGFFLKQIEKDVNEIWKPQGDKEDIDLELGKDFNIAFSNVSPNGEVNYQIIIKTGTNDLRYPLTIREDSNEIYSFTPSSALTKTLGKIGEDNAEKAKEFQVKLADAEKRHRFGR